MSLSTFHRCACLGLLVLISGCGGGRSDDPSTASSQGAGERRERAMAAPTRLAVALPSVTDPLLDGLSIPADAASRGMWGPVQGWPMNAIHAALLPDGKVLSYGAPQNGDQQDGRTFSVWTPSLGFAAGAHAVSFEAGRVNSFCSAATWLGDGRLFISGGNTPRGSQLYTTASLGAVNDTAQLADDRWYATMLTLPDGRAVMLGGIDPYTEGMYLNPDAAIAAGQASMTPELYTPGIGWRSLSGATSRLAFGPDHLRASYPRAWVAPSGEVFGISADQMWWLDLWGNGGHGALRPAGTFKGAPSTTAPLNVGATNSAVMFAPGRILQVGGNGGFNGDGFPASDMATVVDINGTGPVLSETARMSAPRRFPNATVLPDGKVLVTGGTRRGNNGGSDAVYAGELWNPGTRAWTPTAAAARIRVYHSGALLLPNGTVLSLGGGTPGPVYNQNVEVYYPPYLFRATAGGSALATRPVMTGLSAAALRPGRTLQVEMQASQPVARLVLVKGGTVTHSFNNGQRLVELAFSQAADLLTATLPASGNTLPPGVWQLFALDAAGTPSRAALIRIDPADATLPRDVPLALAASHVPDSAMATDAAGLGVLGALPGLPSDAQRAAAGFAARSGLADAACVSLESVAQPGRWLRHAGYRLQLAGNDGSELFRNDATFCPEPGLAGHSLTLRSKNYPGYVLRERDGQLWIDPQADDTRFRNSATWNVRLLPTLAATPLPVLPALPAAPLPAGGGAVTYAPGLEGTGLSFSWSFGDGSPATAWSPSSATSRPWTQPGVYTVTLTVRNEAGATRSTSFVQAVHAATTGTAPRSSTALLVEPRGGASARLWSINPDNDSVAVIDTATLQRTAVVAVGAAPRSIARAPNGTLWVVNRDSASISIIDPASLAVVRTVALPRASQPQALVFAPDGSAAWVTLGAAARLLRLDPASGAQTGAWATGAEPRGLAVSGDSSRLYVSRFISAPLPGEGSTSVTTSGDRGGEVWVWNTAAMGSPQTVWLRHSDRADNEIQGAGLPNYLGAPALSPDGRSAWVPSKQDNVRRGPRRNGLALDFQNTVRAVSSRIDLGLTPPAEVADRRIDHDNASVAAAALYDPTGSYLFVALETSRQVAVVDAARGAELMRLEVQLAPQALAISAGGLQLHVQNFLSRTVTTIDLSPLMTQGRLVQTSAVNTATLAADRLPPQVLLGKQLFHDARDPRLARDAYMSCATCHADGGHDGRTWDLSGQGEGLRNTISLRGRAGLGHGRLHWSQNFDEVQDFETQIRTLAGGTGLMSDAAYFSGTRAQPLGQAKAGQSAELDALAAYVGSLGSFAPSAARNASGALSGAAANGRTVFARQQCASCHGGSAFTASAADNRHDIGTLKASSGARLGGTLGGIDVPTLRDVASTAPYLHDGSAATLEQAISAHAGLAIGATDLANLAQYLREIGSEEAGAPVLPTSGSGLRADYYAGAASFAGRLLVTRTEAVDFGWGTSRPTVGVPADGFSVRWSGTLTVPTSGSYTFRTVSDDGVRLWVGGTQRISNWNDHATTANTSGSIRLTAGQRVSVVLEYYERGGDAEMRLQWRPPGSSAYVAIPAAQLNW